MKSAVLPKRIFDRAQDSDRKELSFVTTQVTKVALADVARALGRTEQELISEFLEMGLQEYVRAGVITKPAPEGEVAA